jgi:hypothetical protein
VQDASEVASGSQHSGVTLVTTSQNLPNTAERRAALPRTGFLFTFEYAMAELARRWWFNSRVIARYTVAVGSVAVALTGPLLLSICRSIVEAHGGRLRASSNSPRGSIFQFTLPAAVNGV